MEGSIKGTRELVPWIGDTPLGVEYYSVVNMPPHSYEDVLEIIYCLQGECTLTVSTDTIRLREGQFGSADREAYYITDGEDCICASIYLDIRHFMKEYPQLQSAMFICDSVNEDPSPESCNQLKGVIISLLHRLLHEPPLTQRELGDIADSLMQLLLGRFEIFFFMNRQREIPDAEVIRRYQIINKYIVEHLEGTISVSDLARELDLTPGYVSEFCRRYAVGFRNMVAYRRVVEAEKHLLSTNRSMEFIAAECGFSDKKYLYRAFRQWHLIGPNQYRKLYREMVQLPETTERVDPAIVRHLVDENLEKHYRQMFLPV